jgi:heme-degrading monooxygenase HmoA
MASRRTAITAVVAVSIEVTMLATRSPGRRIAVEAMNRTALACILLAFCFTAGCGVGRQAVTPPVSPVPTDTGAVSLGRTEMQPLTIDLQAHPNLQFRIDAFSVPTESRSEFEAAMHQNVAFLEKLPGFKGHTVFEKTSGPTSFNIVTIAIWESPKAMASAGEKVRAYYQSIGFDMHAMIARWGVTASLGNYRAPLALQ